MQITTRIKRVKIHQKCDLILIEDVDGYDDYVTIRPGTRLFCGCCGNIVGVTTKRLKFPFQFKELKATLEECSIEKLFGGVYHKTCGHTIAAHNGVNFLSVKSFFQKLKDSNKCVL